MYAPTGPPRADQACAFATRHRSAYRALYPVRAAIRATKPFLLRRPHEGDTPGVNVPTANMRIATRPPLRWYRQPSAGARLIGVEDLINLGEDTV